MQEKRITFEQENSIDIGFDALLDGDKIVITITDDWCGDSETGFGASLSYNLNRKQAMKLAEFLLESLKSNTCH